MLAVVFLSSHLTCSANQSRQFWGLQSFMIRLVIKTHCNDHGWWACAGSMGTATLRTPPLMLLRKCLAKWRRWWVEHWPLSQVSLISLVPQETSTVCTQKEMALIESRYFGDSLYGLFRQYKWTDYNIKVIIIILTAIISLFPRMYFDRYSVCGDRDTVSVCSLTSHIIMVFSFRQSQPLLLR